MVEIEWIESTEFPEVLSEAQNGFSVDVLVYCAKTGEHTIAWYNFNQMQWNFLCREVNFKNFKWRYFVDKLDRYEQKRNPRKRH
jgi:hypothetical protein